MPTYDYKCLKCENKFELFQPITSVPLKTCPKCGGIVKRLIGTGTTPIFKGSGFYQTDYKKYSSAGGGGNGKAATEKTTSASETKSQPNSAKKLK